MNGPAAEPRRFSAFWPVWPAFVALCVFFAVMDYAAWQQRRQARTALQEASQVLSRARVLERTLYQLGQELLARAETSPTARQLVQELQLKRNPPPEVPNP